MFSKRTGLRAGLAALLAAVLLGGAGCASPGKEEALLWEASAGTAANDVTCDVERGTLMREFSASATVTYARQVTVYLETDEAQYVEHTVVNGQQVKKGDVLAVFRKKTDNVRLKEIELSLWALETERTDGLYDRDKADEELQEQLYELEILPDDQKTYRVYVEQQVLLQKLERSRVEREQFQLRIDERKRALEEERAQIWENEAGLTVTAPMDGVVANVQYLSSGVTCYRGQPLLRLYDPESVLLTAGAGILGDFRVGQRVNIEYGRSNDRRTTTGVVVAADGLLPAALRGSGAAIALDEALNGDDLLNPTVTSVEIELKDVLLVPRTAVTNESGGQYVYIDQDGSPRKRYVQVGPSDLQHTAILDGLQEGQPIVLE